MARSANKDALKLQKLRLNTYSEIEKLIGKHPGDESNLRKINFNPQGKSAIILVSGFGGTGLYTFLHILENFKGVYSNIIFIRSNILWRAVGIFQNILSFKVVA